MAGSDHLVSACRELVMPSDLGKVTPKVGCGIFKSMADLYRCILSPCGGHKSGLVGHIAAAST